MFCDDYGHTFPIGHTIVKMKNLTYMYEDVTKVVAVSSYCIAGIAPSLTMIEGHRKPQVVQMYEITADIDEILLGLVTGYNI